ncbi:hypothetical protein DSO57_1025852 [Entomophthora muscae]|uniref:Uncharacterized protein n=1 Tax=Entomophthora muscae TaxID=34485 RepID=A0ACC2TPE9_9FUNG|nr:hypothetical protein DSO57_1025852 [Entomophthora muscae]
MLEAGGLFRFLGSSEYSIDIVEVFKQGSPVLCRYMIEFIESIQLFPFTPPNQDNLLFQITHDILQRNLDCVSPAFAIVEYSSTADQVKFLATFIKPIRLASQDQTLANDCNFSPLLFKVTYDLIFVKEKCSILHCLFLTLVDSLVGAIANHPSPISAVQSASYLLLDLKAASRANDAYKATSQSDEDLKLTLYLLQLSLHAMYLGIKARTDPPEHIVTSLRLAIESGPDLDLIKNPPQPRDPPLDLSHLPAHLSFTGAILVPPKKIDFDFIYDDL